MKSRLSALFLLINLVVATPLLAQKPALEIYQIKIITTDGNRDKGILVDVTDSTLYYDPGINYSPNHYPRQVPLDIIRKVNLRRNSKRRAVLSGGIIGGLTFGYLTIEGFKKNPTSNGLTAGITVLLASSAGVAAGLIVGSAIGNVAHRTLRPVNRENGLDDFRRQLEPFSVRYQTNVFNRINP